MSDNSDRFDHFAAVCRAGIKRKVAEALDEFQTAWEEKDARSLCCGFACRRLPGESSTTSPRRNLVSNMDVRFCPQRDSPCGRPKRPMTSMDKVVGRPVDRRSNISRSARL